MNSIPKILRCRRIVSISCNILKKYKRIKCSEINVSKFRRIVSSGCIVAGCCFSKQSEDEALLPRNETSNISDNANVPKVDTEGCESSGIEDYVKKGNTECVVETISNYSCSLDILQTEPKKTKVIRDFVTKNQVRRAGHNIIKDSNTSNSRNDANSVFISEPSHKKTKTETYFLSTEHDESTKSDIIKNTNFSFSNDVVHSVHISEPAPKRLRTDKDFAGSSQDNSVKSRITQNADSSSSKETLKKKRKERPQKQRPNYFVAVQISNDEILQSLTSVQDSILQAEEKLKKSMISPKTMHITLMVMYIGDLETHGRAMKALQNTHQEHDDDFSKNPLQLEFKGLSHFQNRVLYAKVSNDDGVDRLSSLAQRVKEHFAAASIFTTDTKGFTPHLTVAKIDFKSKNQGVKKIDPLHYKEFTNEYFGSQIVESLQLLRMTGPKNEAGYYSGDEIFFSGFHPRDRIEALKKLLSIEEQKKDVKDKINKLLKEKLK